MKNTRYTIWADAYWDALGHGMNDAKASKYANEKRREYDQAVAKLRATDPGPALVEDGEDSCIVLPGAYH